MLLWLFSHTLFPPIGALLQFQLIYTPFIASQLPLAHCFRFCVTAAGSLPHWERHTSHNKHTNLGRVTNTGAVSHCYLVKNFLITIPVCFLLFTSLLLLFVMVDCHCGLHLDLQVYLLLRIARLSHSRLIVGLNFKIFIYIVFASIASSCFVFVAFYKLV